MNKLLLIAAITFVSSYTFACVDLTGEYKQCYNKMTESYGSERVKLVSSTVNGKYTLETTMDGEVQPTVTEGMNQVEDDLRINISCKEEESVIAVSYYNNVRSGTMILSLNKQGDLVQSILFDVDDMKNAGSLDYICKKK